MPKGVKKEDEGRNVLEKVGQYYLREISPERLEEAEDLLSWCRTVGDHGLTLDRWYERQSAIKRLREITLTLSVPQVLGMYSLLTLIGFKPVKKFTILSQDDYGHVVVSVETTYATGRYKLLSEGGYEELDPVPHLPTEDGGDGPVDLVPA